jgi:hypothetical protein
MGAWGHGLYDNDTAMDCITDYEGYLKQGYNVKDALDMLKNSWYLKDNWSVLVIGDLEIKNFKKLMDDMKPILQRTIEEEIKLTKEWKQPKEREKVLNNFYNGIKSLL